MAAASFVDRRSKMLVQNRQEIGMAYGSNNQNKEGYDLTRLVNPTIDQINEDFLCAICQKIVNNPIECTNPECG